jgi:hypothetical protein
MHLQVCEEEKKREKNTRALARLARPGVAWWGDGMGAGAYRAASFCHLFLLWVRV